MDQLIGILAFIALGIGMAGVSGGIAEQSWEWFESLDMPSATPRAPILRGAWAAAHICFGAAAWIVWQSEAFAGAPLAFGLAGGTLVAAVGWAAVVFRLRSLRSGFFLICGVWVVSALSVAAFTAEAGASGLLSAPMLLVMTGVGVLNFIAWQLNQDEPSRPGGPAR